MDSRGQKLRIFRKRKMPLTYIGHLKMGFTRFLIKNLARNFFDNCAKKESLTEIRLYSLITVL